jgi:ABC-type Mn2+/Zn2+ transport system ATPase subunit
MVETAEILPSANSLYLGLTLASRLMRADGSHPMDHDSISSGPSKSKDRTVPLSVQTVVDALAMRPIQLKEAQNRQESQRLETWLQRVSVSAC